MLPRRCPDCNMPVELLRLAWASYLCVNADGTRHACVASNSSRFGEVAGGFDGAAALLAFECNPTLVTARPASGAVAPFS